MIPNHCTDCPEHKECVHFDDALEDMRVNGPFAEFEAVASIPSSEVVPPEDCPLRKLYCVVEWALLIEGFRRYSVVEDYEGIKNDERFKILFYEDSILDADHKARVLQDIYEQENGRPRQWKPEKN
jgi:hypothetical protein